MIKQIYSKRSNARRAAVADLGKEAVEGIDYEIIKQAPARFVYKPVSAPTKVTSGSGTERPPKGKTATTAADRADKRDKFGLRLGTKRAQAAAMLEKGCKMAEVRAKTGMTHYDLLKRLEETGHQVSCNSGMIQLTAKK